MYNTSKDIMHYFSAVASEDPAYIGYAREKFNISSFLLRDIQ